MPSAEPGLHAGQRRCCAKRARARPVHQLLRFSHRHGRGLKSPATANENRLKPVVSRRKRRGTCGLGGGSSAPSELWDDSWCPRGCFCCGTLLHCQCDAEVEKEAPQPNWCKSGRPVKKRAWKPQSRRGRRTVRRENRRSTELLEYVALTGVLPSVSARQ